MVRDFTLESVLYCLLASALIVLSVIDWRTYEIPLSINGFILVLGILHMLIDYKNWLNYVIGFFCIIMILYLLFLISKGRAIGGGDIKLMATCGLLIGWQNIIIGFLLGCSIGSVIDLIRMKISDADRVLAMGPYLAAGTMIAALWGQDMIAWYLGAMM